LPRRPFPGRRAPARAAAAADAGRAAAPPVGAAPRRGRRPGRLLRRRAADAVPGHPGTARRAAHAAAGAGGGGRGAPPPPPAPRPPERAPAWRALLLEWQASDSPDRRADLYRRAGDRYAQEHQDWQSALRCYSAALDADPDLTFDPADSWLVMTLK